MYLFPSNLYHSVYIEMKDNMMLLSIKTISQFS